MYLIPWIGGLVAKLRENNFTITEGDVTVKLANVRYAASAGDRMSD
jgi:hypothetical protein